MDFYLEDVTTCQDTHINGREESHLTEDEEGDLLGGNVSMTELQDQHSSSSIDIISKRMQELVEKINDSRASNQKVMDSFQEKLVAKVTETCLLMKEHVYMVYEDNSNEMQVKLQELSLVLESCSKLYNELLEANQALASLRDGLAISQTSESQ